MPEHTLSGRARARRSRETAPDAQQYVSPEFGALVDSVSVVSFSPYIPCSVAAMQPSATKVSQTITIDGTPDCVWCATSCPAPNPKSMPRPCSGSNSSLSPAACVTGLPAVPAQQCVCTRAVHRFMLT